MRMLFEGVLDNIKEDDLDKLDNMALFKLMVKVVREIIDAGHGVRALAFIEQEMSARGEDEIVQNVAQSLDDAPQTPAVQQAAQVSDQIANDNADDDDDEDSGRPTFSAARGAKILAQRPAVNRVAKVMRHGHRNAQFLDGDHDLRYFRLPEFLKRFPEANSDELQADLIDQALKASEKEYGSHLNDDGYIILTSPSGESSLTERSGVPGFRRTRARSLAPTARPAPATPPPAAASGNGGAGTPPAGGGTTPPAGGGGGGTPPSGGNEQPPANNGGGATSGTSWAADERPLPDKYIRGFLDVIASEAIRTGAIKVTGSKRDKLGGGIGSKTGNAASGGMGFGGQGGRQGGQGQTDPRHFTGSISTAAISRELNRMGIVGADHDAVMALHDQAKQFVGGGGNIMDFKRRLDPQQQQIFDKFGMAALRAAEVR